MNSKFPLNQVFVRTPFYPFKNFLDIPVQENQLDGFIDTLWHNDIFKESIFVASPELYYEWEKLYKTGKTEAIKRKNIAVSILKYYIRSATRSTPFGLFSCYSNQPINTESETCNTSYDSEYERFTSIDMLFLYSIIRVLNANEHVQKVLKYSVNNSLYRIGADYRYVEVILKDNKRSHVLTSLEHDEVLTLLFNECESKKSIAQIAQCLLDNVENVTLEQVLPYVHDLITSQILISDLDISLNGNAPLTQLLDFYDANKDYLKQNSYTQKIFDVLKEIQIINSQIDSKILGNSPEVFEKIYKLVDSLGINYQKKYLVNTNLRKNTSTINIDAVDIKKINESIEIVSRFTDSKKTKQSLSAKNIESFKERFYKRYEEKEIPLVVALDNEIGVGYIDTKGNNSFSNLIDDVNWSDIKTNAYNIEYNQAIHGFWSKLFLKANAEALYEIDLKDYDLSGFNPQSDNLAKTYSVMINKTSDKLIYEYAGGSSSLDMITRFSNLDHKLDTLVEDVVKYEQVDPNAVYTEILHVPDDRQGNVLLRKINRQYETPFLSKESNENIIAIQDILVSVKKDKMVLRSIKLNKEIRFYNTTAHNFYYNSLPIYQFLCDLQYQDILSGLSLNFGDINNKTFRFLPRIAYKKAIVLSPATWNISEQDYKDFAKKNSIVPDSENFESFLKSSLVPEYFFMVEGDNQLLINFDNQILISILFEELTKKKSISLKECLFDIKKDDYCNEILIPYINNNHEPGVMNFDAPKQEIKRKFVPGDEWLYYKIFTGIKTADKILTGPIHDLVAILKENKLIESWFFLRYNDSDFHIRVRFKVNHTTDNAVGKIISIFNNHLRDYVDSLMVWKVELSTYERELERYEWEYINFSEQFFYRDSDLLLALMRKAKENGEDDISWVFTVKCIDAYFDLFKCSLEEKYKIMNSLYSAFQEEFEADKKLRKQIDNKFRFHVNSINQILESDSGQYQDYRTIISNAICAMEHDFTELQTLEPVKVKRILTSLIHMHINRIIKSNPRAHELILYGFFEKHYRQLLGKKKHITKTYC